MKLCILFILSLFFISCSQDDVLFNDQDSQYLGFRLYIKDKEGNILDQSPQSNPYWAAFDDTLKLYAALYKYNDTDTVALKNQYLGDLNEVKWILNNKASKDIQTQHFSADSTETLYTYIFEITDLNGDKKSDTLKIQTLEGL